MIKRLLRAAVSLFACAGPHVLHAQTLTIRLVNGETGKPMKNYNVTVNWDNNFKPTVVRIGQDGIVQIDANQGSASFVLSPGPRDGKEPNRIAYLNCSRGPTSQLNIHEALTNGIVPENTCSSKTLKAKPGEVVFWARPRHFWEPDLQ